MYSCIKFIFGILFFGVFLISMAEAKDILVLGGTQFLGKHIVETALERGHRVTLFNRGKTHPELFPHVEKLAGDRYSDFSALEKRNWDLVIDVSGYLADNVAEVAQFMNDRTRYYVFISSISAYKEVAGHRLDESSALHEEGEGYGPQKALCEKAVQERFNGKILIVRPGIIVGPDDTTYRFAYWVDRFSENEEVLVPKDSHAECQWIDVRDLARWILLMIENGEEGKYNAVGPRQPILLRDFFMEFQKLFPRTLRWVSPQLLEKDLPFYYPTLPGIFHINSQKAYQKGLTLRPLSESIRDTDAWLKGLRN